MLARVVRRGAPAFAGIAALTVGSYTGAAPVTPEFEEPACKPIVLCGPSGAGKSTLIKRLMKEYPGMFGFSVSHTTRSPRKGEKEGVDYHYVTNEVMEREIEEHMFLEHARVHNAMYGTSKVAVDRVTASKRVCILDIDIQGVRQVKACQRRGDFDAAMYIFIAPPTLDELDRRLRLRGTETEEKIALRLRNAAVELRDANAIHWDAYIVNDNIDDAAQTLHDVVKPVIKNCASCREM